MGSNANNGSQDRFSYWNSENAVAYANSNVSFIYSLLLFLNYNSLVS